MRSERRDDYESNPETTSYYYIYSNNRDLLGEISNQLLEEGVPSRLGEKVRKTIRSNGSTNFIRLTGIEVEKLAQEQEVTPPHQLESAPVSREEVARLRLRDEMARTRGAAPEIPPPYDGPPEYTERNSRAQSLPEEFLTVYSRENLLIAIRELHNRTLENIVLEGFESQFKRSKKITALNHIFLPDLADLVAVKIKIHDNNENLDQISFRTGLFSKKHPAAEEETLKALYASAACKLLEPRSSPENASSSAFGIAAPMLSGGRQS